MAQQSGKNVVICLDGTGNQFREENTNVVKLFRVLHREPQSQVAYYDPGVGTLADPSYKMPISKKINKVMGLAFGRGLTHNIEQAYSYLMEHYEPDDRIFLFGFSRGAYTARALAGFIHAVGLLEKGCQNLIPYAMKLYQARKVDFQILQKFKSTYGRSCHIHFLGLWDSVSTLGWIYDPVFLPYTTNNKSVQAVRHALAIDERRAFFRQLHWGHELREQQDVKEVWFAGVHSDVGGGYPEAESGLAKIALKWMIDEASKQKFGLLINQSKYDRYVLGINSKGKYTGPDDSAAAHESLKGPWWLVQYLPQRVWLPLEHRKAIRIPQQQRPIETGATLHASVLNRITAGNYNPPNLPVFDEAGVRERFSIEE
jgi:uncharacterized protein (DUF2235 family)